MSCVRGAHHQCRHSVQDSQGCVIQTGAAARSFGKATQSELKLKKNTPNKVLRNYSEPLGGFCKSMWLWWGVFVCGFGFFLLVWVVLVVGFWFRLFLFVFFLVGWLVWVLWLVLF